MAFTYRAAAMRYRCPQCKARRDEPCIGTKGERVACHQARHDKALRCGAREVIPPNLRQPIND